MIFKINFLFLTLSEAISRYRISAEERIQGRFDEIIEFIKTVSQFDKLMQILLDSKNIIFFVILSGAIVTIIALLGKGQASKNFHSPKRLLLATGHLVTDVFKAFPPLVRTLVAVIIVIVGLGLFNKNNMTDIQIPKAPPHVPIPVPEKPVAAPAPNAPVPAPAPIGKPKIIVTDSIKGKWHAVKFVVKDKTTLRSHEYSVKLGSDFLIPNSNLKVTVSEFLPDFRMDVGTITSASNEPNNPAVRITVRTNDNKELYTGWLYSKFPSLHPFEHKRFSITLKEGIPISSTIQAVTPAPAPSRQPRVQRSAPAPSVAAQSISDRQETIARYIRLGNALIDSNEPDYDKAIQQFKRALVLDPDNNEALKDIKKVENAKAAEDRRRVLGK